MEFCSATARNISETACKIYAVQCYVLEIEIWLYEILE